VYHMPCKAGSSALVIDSALSAGLLGDLRGKEKSSNR